MFNWWYFLFILINSLQAQNPFDGGGFLADPFLELTAGVTTPINQKSNKSESTCITNGALAGSIIGTLLLSAFIAFLTWMVYLRQKLHELKSYENRGRNFYEQNCHLQSSLVKPINYDQTDQNGNPLPLDVTDFKFGTFPFRQSQTPNTNGHCNTNEWLNRVPSSFRSSTSDQNFQTMDIELLNPTFCGLNFSITGNMRAGIFIRDILDKQTVQGQVKLNSSDQLRTGDRILALTICFESIVYEDALTILSYASPYPVILRVQRSIHPTKSSTITEKRTNTTNKVKWRDDFEHYDNDTSYNRSADQMDSSKTLISETKKAAISTKGNKKKLPPPSSSSSTTKQKNKRLNPKKKVIENKKSKPIIIPSTGITSKPIEKQPSTTKKSVTNAVISYLHYRGANGIYSTDAGNPGEGGAMTYYDSPYDYYSSHLNRNNNNNNSVDIEPLSTVKSTYQLELSQKKTNPLNERICQRRLSSSGVSISSTIDKLNPKDLHIDTFV